MNDGKTRLYYWRWSKGVTQFIRYKCLLRSFCEWDPFWGQEWGDGLQWAWFSIKPTEKKVVHRAMTSDDILASPFGYLSRTLGRWLPKANIKLQPLTLYEHITEALHEIRVAKGRFRHLVDNWRHCKVIHLKMCNCPQLFRQCGKNTFLPCSSDLLNLHW